ncbi:zinc-binding oxidoreductase-like protein ToxD [Aspergillus uvarum CBS 121591]|uniref:Zinc-binding oxidoreductase-like protein ToxD n=1 Tax=Aspergillus uvarum CBS 121591 TaxID=1448315 RepID=A0A319CFG9_9EURO|nr:zinc-binding oxidoreductase-like protein ToxD [Aspergillus uvarum CBS 121591]PYH84596.1 zinc-binding oxidoreductase-like protein ToxD [Aspergillus uvarum CBS 121591]
MQEALVFSSDSSLEVKLHSVPIPSPGPNEVLIKVAASGTNPKDWKFPEWFDRFNGTNTGDDIAGYVHEVGENVVEFKVGDRVAAFHDYMAPHGSFAEYAIGKAHATFHLPPHISFEAAATVPLAAATASLALFARLGLPEPWVAHKSWANKPRGGVLVYGAASAVGSFVIKWLQRADIHPVIGIAGRGQDYAKSLMSTDKGDVVIDYRDGESAVIRAIRDAIPAGESLQYAVDAVSETSSFKVIHEVLDQTSGAVSIVTPERPKELAPTIRVEFSNVGTYHTEDRDFAWVWTRVVSRGLFDGWLKPHPHTLVPGGLNGVQSALTNLRAGKASAVKYVVQVSQE